MKFFLIVTAFFFSMRTVYAQEYDPEKLRATAVIWGEVYLFHPSVICVDKNIDWEKHLVSFLPKIKGDMTTESFIDLVNGELLSVLEDYFTVVQKRNHACAGRDIASSSDFDYWQISSELLCAPESILEFNDRISDRTSLKPLVFDLRADGFMNIDHHVASFFYYLASTLIEKPIRLSSHATRRHTGWDELNEWWYYQQGWDINEPDRQVSDGNTLHPFSFYAETPSILYRFGIEDEKVNTEPISRPVYFITNNSFISAYRSLLDDLMLHRPDTFVINEMSGEFHSYYGSYFKKYPFPKYDFILNAGVAINKDRFIHSSISHVSTVDCELISKFISSKKMKATSSSVDLSILPSRYESAGRSLTMEEKILGVIKVWTVIRKFHVNRISSAGYIEKCLGKYLDLIQKSQTDKDYWELIQEMLAPLNDSHISVYHPSLLDLSSMFAAPLKFEWIENKAIITWVDREFIDKNIGIGDEILSIDGVPVDELITNNKKRISYSNMQGLLSVVINPGFFVGPHNSIMNIGVACGRRIKSFDLYRATPVFALFSSDQRKATGIMSGNVGYLDLSLESGARLKDELRNMQNTEGLIIDLRNTYPTADFKGFIDMLCNEPTVTRIAEVPIVTFEDVVTIRKEISVNLPVEGFSYTKPIAVLVDKSMISRPEDIAIALRALPNVIIIGEQTQGTDGEVAKIYMPGGGEVLFTGQSVFYGNGSDFFGKGIIPDIMVEKTVKDIREGRDILLETALKHLSKKINVYP